MEHFSVSSGHIQLEKLEKIHNSLIIGMGHYCTFLCVVQILIENIPPNMYSISPDWEKEKTILFVRRVPWPYSLVNHYET